MSVINFNSNKRKGKKAVSDGEAQKSMGGRGLELSDFDNITKVYDRKSFEQFFGHIECDSSLSPKALLEASECTMVRCSGNLVRWNVYMSDVLLINRASYFQCLALGRVFHAMDVNYLRLMTSLENDKGL